MTHSSQPQNWFRQKMPLLLTMLFVIAASVIISQYLFERRNSNLQGTQLVSVIFASNKIDQGDLIEADDIEIKQMPAQYVHVRTVPAHLKHMVIGRMSATALKKGEPLLWDAVYMDDTDSLSDKLGLAERAVTLPVDELNSFNGLVNPGDRVDIMAIMHASKLGEEATLTPLLQNISVLAVNDRTTRRSSRMNEVLPKQGSYNTAQTITVKVSPNDAALLAYAQTQGRIVVSLRNPDDIFVSNIPYVNQSNLGQLTKASTDYPTLRFDPSKNAPYLRQQEIFAQPVYAADDHIFQQVNIFNQDLVKEVFN